MGSAALGIALLSACTPAVPGATPVSKAPAASAPTVGPEGETLTGQQQATSTPASPEYPSPDVIALLPAKYPHDTYICTTLQAKNIHTGAPLQSGPQWIAIYKLAPSVGSGSSRNLHEGGYMTVNFDHSTVDYIYIFSSNAAEQAAGRLFAAIGPTPTALPSGRCDPSSLVYVLQ